MKLATIILFCLFVSTSNAQEWVNVGNGIEKNIYDLISYQNNLYAAGRLGNSLRGVYFWDGQSWNETNSIPDLSYPLTLELFQDSLYTSGGGSFSSGSPTKVFKWTGIEWEQIGDNFSNGNYNSIRELKSFNNKLYAAGTFDQVGSINCKNIAEWNGEQWVNLGDGVNGEIINVDVLNDELIVCEQIIEDVQINDSTTYNLARRRLLKWDGSTWTNLDSIFENKNIDLIRVIDNKAYFATYDTFFVSAIKSIEYWDGNEIMSIGDTTFRYINDVSLHEGSLYVAGRVKTENPNNNIPQIKVFNGSVWGNVGAGFNDSVLELHVHNDELFCSGFYNQYGNIPMNYVSMLDVTNSTLNLSNQISEIEIIPNPTIGEFEISSTSSLIQAIKIYTISGNSIFNNTNVLKQKEYLNLNFIEAGIYIVEVDLVNGIRIVDKLIKN